MEPIVHICHEREWQSARRAGEYRGNTLDTQGFIHGSKPEQVLRVANTFYRDVHDLILLWIDPQKLKPELRWEASDDDVFPHIYGPINLDAVYARTELLSAPAGGYLGFTKPE